MRIVLCTMGGLPGAAVLRILRGSPAIEVAGVVRSTRLDSLRHLRRSGLRYSAYLGALMLRPLRAGVPVHATRDANDAATTAFIERLAPELVVTAFFNQRLERPGVNLHPALLPALRGVDPVFYARLLGGAPLGVTLHRLVREFDAGPIVAQREVEILAGESVLAATVRLYEEGARLLVERLADIRAGVARPQAGAPSYYSWPTRAQVAELRGKGVSLVRWRDLLARAP